MIKAVFLMTLFLSVSTGIARAHGVTVVTSLEGRVVVVSSLYSPHQPLVDASVSVYSPADPENAWQTGRTDKTGHFAFVPDAEGEWAIVIDDRQGHLKRTTLTFTPDFPAESEMPEQLVTEPAAPVEYRLSNIHRIIIGLSLIIGITGLFYGLKVRQERKSE